MVELLLAMTLAALLLVGLFGVISSMACSSLTISAEQEARDWHAGVAELIQQDLQAAERFEAAADQLRLVAYSGIDEDRRIPSQQWSVIEYRVQVVGGESWLVRRQSDADDDGSRDSWVEPICRGVREMNILADDTVPTERTQQQLPTMPSMVRLQLVPASHGLHPVDRVLVID